MIGTKRLTLRHWRSSDLDPFAEVNACEKVCEFLPGVLTREESDAFAQRIIDHFEKNGFGLYAVETKDTGQFIGFTGLSIPNFSANFMPAVEIGWRLSDAHWGKGFATEAAKAVLRHGFEELGLKEIVSFTVPENIASRRVMEKIGLRHDASNDFDHPDLPDGHKLKRHVFYRLENDQSTKARTK